MASRLKSNVGETEDLMALTLRLCDEEGRVAHCDRLCADIDALRRRLESATARRTQLMRQFQRKQTAVDSNNNGGTHDVFQAWLQQHVTTCVAGFHVQQLTQCSVHVRFRPLDGAATDQWRLELAWRDVTDDVIDDVTSDGEEEEVRVVSSCVPPCVSLSTLLQRFPLKRQMPLLLRHISLVLEAFVARRRQVAALDAATPASWSATWHDPGLLDVRPTFRLLCDSQEQPQQHHRVQITLALKYKPDAYRPFDVKLYSVEPHDFTLPEEDRDSILHESLPHFKAHSMLEAYQRAFADQ